MQQAMKASGRRTMVRQILILYWCLLFGGIQMAGYARADELDEAFSSLKSQFESQARLQNAAPAQLTILGLETTARAWTLAAIGLTEDPEAKEEWRNRAVQLTSPIREPGRKGTAIVGRDLDDRHSAALEIYYQAFRETVLYLVTVNQQKPLAREMRRIHRLTMGKLARLTNQPQRELEKQVILSGALVSLVTVAVRSLGGNLLSPQLEGLVRGWVERAETLSRRSDLHYRARLQLLYISNLRHLTALVFALGRQAGPPLSRELAGLHGNLNLYGPQRGLPGAQSLIWAAQAQASIPMAYWLSHHRPETSSLKREESP